MTPAFVGDFLQKLGAISYLSALVEQGGIL